ncbi:hypothetical protein QR680_011002 [Steinernema hermaphroditum]|uniref:Uncharacterized protein n=1 Tax=Steinernema hermaphroditum TaxID=289476 RepID=A0AA39ITA7_9BILA|nr:hypothetical protein QR680_011002 [Steinernema hermaphroditum]
MHGVTALLLLGIAVVAGSPDSEPYEPCDVLLFRDSYIAFGTEYGLVYVSGNQSSLEVLNEKINFLARKKSIKSPTLKRDRVAIFSDLKRSSILSTQFALDEDGELNELRVGVVRMNDLTSKEMGFLHYDIFEEHEMNRTTGVPYANKKSTNEFGICLPNTRKFRSEENVLEYDFNRTISFRTEISPTQHFKYFERYNGSAANCTEFDDDVEPIPFQSEDGKFSLTLHEDNSTLNALFYVLDRSVSNKSSCYFRKALLEWNETWVPVIIPTNSISSLGVQFVEPQVGAGAEISGAEATSTETPDDDTEEEAPDMDTEDVAPDDDTEEEMPKFDVLPTLIERKK